MPENPKRSGVLGERPASPAFPSSSGYVDVGVLELHWERGYEATSMADLVRHLGIARASIYATFGGKHDLYVKALDRYLLARDPSLVVVLSQPGEHPVQRYRTERGGSCGEDRRSGVRVC